MTRYDLFRKRIAPIAFFCAIGFIAYDSCNKQQRTKATLVFDYGAAAPHVRDVEAELWMNKAMVAQFHRVAPTGPTTFKVSVPAKDGEVRFDVEMDEGVHKQFTHVIHAEEGATVTVPLEHDLL